MPLTLVDKIWSAHCVGRRLDGKDLIYIDRHVLHELHAPEAFRRLSAAGRQVRRPELTFGVLDHTVSTAIGRDDSSNPEGVDFIRAMRAGSARFGVRLFDLDDPFQGISHVVGPEIGLILPGMTYACPDSHASTVGGLGALAFACGTSELEHVLSTQTIAVTKPRSLRVALDGAMTNYVSGKDVALRVLAEIGVSGAQGHIVEYAGSTIDELGIEGRLTLCNLSIEMGARSGIIAADDSTYEWLEGRPYAPTGSNLERAVAAWKEMRSDPDASFDDEVRIDCAHLEPYLTWGTDPSQALPVSGHIPGPESVAPERQERLSRSLAYMDLAPGTPLIGLPIDRAFIGSCTNSRLSDLELAADVVAGRHIARGVQGLVVPGSSLVKRQAEALGLDAIFTDAGFSWGEAGCSMCAAGNGDRGEPGERCISTTNRNFENRQGAGVRTHLASPATVAAAAIAGEIVDVREFVNGAC
jgi:3-isopropylmalate/(R)-2-methylmalate dehydratase large subunit